MTAADFADALVKYCVAFDAAVVWWGPPPRDPRAPTAPEPSFAASWLTALVQHLKPQPVNDRQILAAALGLRIECVAERDRISAPPPVTE